MRLGGSALIVASLRAISISFCQQSQYAVPFSFAEPDDANLDPIRRGQHTRLLTIGNRNVLAQSGIKDIREEPREFALAAEMAELCDTEI